MADITEQKVRAQIRVGTITVETPDVLSFNVRRARGQMAATFSASVKLDLSYLGDPIGSDIIIRAGLKGSLRTIFTGTVYKCTANPVRNDASKVVLNMSGKDVLGVLEGQKINRRVKTYRDGSTPPERFGVVNRVIKHKTDKIAKFPQKVTSYKPYATRDLPVIDKEVTPNSYPQAALNKNIKESAINNPSVSKVEVTEEEG